MKVCDVLSVIKTTIVFGLVLISGAQAFASDNDEIQIPRDASVLYQVSYGRPQIAKADAIAGVIQNIQFNESKIDVEYKCQAVYYKWSYDSKTECYRGNGWIGGCLNPFNQLFGTTEFQTARTAAVVAYCAPRSYDQKIVLSLERRCEENPTAECLDEKIKSAIATIQPTARYDIDKPE